jgi:diguanylate cyclase (GGDEF)-like protein
MSRARLHAALENAVSRSEQQGRGAAVILLGIDRFKLANSRFGHLAADSVLHQVAATIHRILNGNGIMGRWSGDEFLCVLPQADSVAGYRVAEQLRAAIEGMVIPMGNSITNVTVSAGVALYPHDASDAHRLLVAADEALYHAKRTGRNRVVTAESLTGHELNMGSVLETALREDRVMPAYQPIVDLATGAVVAEEALARIVTVDGAVIAAEHFMDVASQFQLMHKIDRAIVLSAFSRCNACIGNENRLTHFINVSADLLRHPELLKELFQSVREQCPSQSTGEPTPLVIEVTERELLGNLETTRRMLAPFLELGLRLALDDFGSGYSSFQYLADLPISFLKIDGRLIRRIHEPKVRALVHGIQAIAGDLGLVTLAEYVENERQVELLRAVGVHWAQGHYFGRAVLNEQEARRRREMSVNWTHGYYYHTQA